MVDVTPWGGDYSGTVVRNNLIVGGLADPTNGVEAETGTNEDSVILKYDLDALLVVCRAVLMGNDQDWHRHWTTNLVRRLLQSERVRIWDGA